VALPARSPLLVHSQIPLEEVVDYPLIMWCPLACKEISRQVHDLLTSVKDAVEIVQYVPSFELMAVLVAAGYGIGLSGRAHIAADRNSQIVMRPLRGQPPQLTTHLVYLEMLECPRVRRFARRAAGIRWP
jgi:DNA-binding transcriptional LysR family regulator